MSAVAAVAVSREEVRLLFPATCGEGLADRAPVSTMLQRVLRYPDRVRQQRPVLRLAQR